MKRRRKNKGGKKSQPGKLLFFLILIGLGLAMVFLFRDEIFQALQPRTAKKIPPPEKRSVTLYFSDEEGEFLVPEKREILKKGRTEEEAGEMLTELIKGPKGKTIPTLPPQTKLLSLQLEEGGLAQANFSGALARNHPGGSSAELMTVYSIVNSLSVNFPEIKRVQILVDSREIETIAGHLSLRKPLSPNQGLLKKPRKNPSNH